MNKKVSAALCAACLICASALAEAKSTWKYQAGFYGWGVQVDGDVTVRDTDSGHYWVVDPDDFFDGMPFLFGARLEATNGRFGGFLNLTYLDLDDTGPVIFSTPYASEPIVGDGTLEQSGWLATGPMLSIGFRFGGTPTRRR